MCARYIDRYRKEDGRWRFAKRVVTYDMRSQHSVPGKRFDRRAFLDDPGFGALHSRLFARGPRA